MELKGSAARAAKTVENLAFGRANRAWADNIAQQFFAAVQCLPPNTPGMERFLSDLSRTPNHTQGAYGVMRLVCDKVPELAGRNLDDLADIVAETGQEGIDIVTSSGALREFWEIKYVLDAARAISTRQLRTHLDTKVAAAYRAFRDQGLEGAELVAAMKNIKLKINVISPNASPAAKNTLVAKITAVIAAEYPQLVRAGFKFDSTDVIMRKADPLRSVAQSVAGAVSY